MKYVLVIPDGCADTPQEHLNGQTPLETAHIPHMDRIAQLGCVGRANNVPRSLPAGSDVATISLLGFDPLQHYTGRAPLEAAAMGHHLDASDWAIRCNLVHVVKEHMIDFTAGHITNSEAETLLHHLQTTITQPELRFYPGVSYRNLLIFSPGRNTSLFNADTFSTPPHDITDQLITPHLPSGSGSELLKDLMKHSVDEFAPHPTNLLRIENNQMPATMVWLWGLGKRPDLPTFYDRFGVNACMITGVDLLRGLALLLGWTILDVPGATGYLDTDYAAKGREAVRAIEDFDFVTVHIEATDEASHEGNAAIKIEALEQIDFHIVGPLLKHLEKQDAYRMLVSPDHPTLLQTKTHSHGDVPFALAGTGIKPDSYLCYNENNAARSAVAFPQGHELMPYFLGRGNIP